MRGGAGLGGNTRAGGGTEQNVHSSIIEDVLVKRAVRGHHRNVQEVCHKNVGCVRFVRLRCVHRGYFGVCEELSTERSFS